jgi:hypothetical protein
MIGFTGLLVCTHERRSNADTLPGTISAKRQLRHPRLSRGVQRHRKPADKRLAYNVAVASGRCVVRCRAEPVRARVRLMPLLRAVASTSCDAGGEW